MDEDGIPNHYQAVRHEDRNMVKSPLPHETMDLLQLPDAFDWRNVNGKSYTSVPRWAIISLAVVPSELNKKMLPADPRSFSIAGISTFLSIAVPVGLSQGEMILRQMLRRAHSNSLSRLFSPVFQL